MTTFDDDFIQLTYPDGEIKRARCLDNNIDWPPPERITLMEGVFVRISYSAITDEQRSKLTAVCRGALYQLETH